VAVSLFAIAAGLIAVPNLAQGRYHHQWVVTFLALTFLTAASGFPLPPFGLDPPRIVGVITIAAVALAAIGLFIFKLTGPWRVIFIIGSVSGLYLNVFVAIVQSFQKITLLQAIAPGPDSPIFIMTQITCLAALSALGFRAYRRFSRLSLPFS
jgi:hypothetical protein